MTGRGISLDVIRKKLIKCQYSIFPFFPFMWNISSAGGGLYERLSRAHFFVSRRRQHSARLFSRKAFVGNIRRYSTRGPSRWADEGALRIVPDRAEQYHFKDRMRTLGSYCVMDLTHTTEEANKIRTNKNYNPAKGERNQYILFSDAVQPLPNHSFFTCWTVPRSRPANWPSKR